MSTRAVTVPITGVLLAPYNPRRTALAMWNNGTETCFWSNDPLSTSTQGFPVPTSLPISFAKEFGDDPTLSVYAISQTVNNNFRVYEAFGEGGV